MGFGLGVPRRSRRAFLVLWLGVVALTMNAFAGIGHLEPHAAGEGVTLEICTHAGIVRVGAQWLDPQDAPMHEQAGDMRCCDLCAARCAVAIPEAFPVAIFTIAVDATKARAPQRAAALPNDRYTLTPLVPRAPPACA